MAINMTNINIFFRIWGNPRFIIPFFILRDDLDKVCSCILSAGSYLFAQLFMIIMLCIPFYCIEFILNFGDNYFRVFRLWFESGKLSL
ncbi:hypothetical protein HMPREF2919_00265 [Rothia sp. HMSC068E02]|nr:hypothetical protein HMPREF2919_00265 [Rothia sp. HMSC068E02]